MAIRTSYNWSETNEQLASIARQDGYRMITGLRSYHNALANVDVAPVKIAMIGDSLTWGAWASDIVTNNFVGRLRTVLQAKYGNVGQGNYPVPIAIVSIAQTPWWSVTSGTWATSAAQGIGGRAMYGSSSSVIQLTFTGTAIDLFYRKYLNGSSASSITIDSTPVACPDFYSSNTVHTQKQSYTGLSTAQHVMVITVEATAGKFVYIEDAIVTSPTVSGDKGVYVYNFGTPNATCGNFLSNIANMMTAVAPDLVVLELGINDRTDPAAFLTNMGTLLTAVTSDASCSVLLLIPAPFSTAATNYNNWLTVNQHIYTLADQYDCALLDMTKLWESYALQQADGMYGGNAYDGTAGADQIHPSNKGHRNIGNALARHLIG
jgi:lysophospholipase L1-like esterase